MDAGDGFDGFGGVPESIGDVANKVVSRQLTLESGLGEEIHLLSIIKFKSVAPR